MQQWSCMDCGCVVDEFNFCTCDKADRPGEYTNEELIARIEAAVKNKENILKVPRDFQLPNDDHDIYE